MSLKVAVLVLACASQACADTCLCTCCTQLHVVNGVPEGTPCKGLGIGDNGGMVAMWRRNAGNVTIDGAAFPYNSLAGQRNLWGKKIFLESWVNEVNQQCREKNPAMCGSKYSEIFVNPDHDPKFPGFPGCILNDDGRPTPLDDCIKSDLPESLCIGLVSSGIAGPMIIAIVMPILCICCPIFPCISLLFGYCVCMKPRKEEKGLTPSTKQCKCAQKLEKARRAVLFDRAARA